MTDAPSLRSPTRPRSPRARPGHRRRSARSRASDVPKPGPVALDAPGARSVLDGLPMGMMSRPGRAARTAGLPTPERPRLDVAIRHEAILDRPGDGLPEQPLDAAQEDGIVDAEQAVSLASRHGP